MPLLVGTTASKPKTVFTDSRKRTVVAMPLLVGTTARDPSETLDTSHIQFPRNPYPVQTYT